MEASSVVVKTTFPAVRQIRMKNPRSRKIDLRSARCRAVWRRWRASSQQGSRANQAAPDRSAPQAAALEEPL
jgi:hypothetical protein